MWVPGVNHTDDLFNLVEGHPEYYSDDGTHFKPSEVKPEGRQAAEMIHTALGGKAAGHASASDHWKPRLHFTTPEGWLSDPNELFQLNGVWHVQYQCRWPRAWGHATSKNLLHWENQPVALAPDEHGDCWSGCTVIDRLNTSGLFSGSGTRLVSVYTLQEPDSCRIFRGCGYYQVESQHGRP